MNPVRGSNRNASNAPNLKNKKKSHRTPKKQETEHQVGVTSTDSYSVSCSVSLRLVDLTFLNTFNDVFFYFSRVQNPVTKTMARAHTQNQHRRGKVSSFMRVSCLIIRCVLLDHAGYSCRILRNVDPLSNETPIIRYLLISLAAFCSWWLISSP